MLKDSYKFRQLTNKRKSNLFKMYNVLNVYDCPQCGKRLSDEVEQREDFGNDEHYEWVACDKCGSEVKPRVSCDIKTKQEINHYEEVDDERARRAHGFYDEKEEDDLGYMCENCGGVIADDWSTCFCNDDNAQDEIFFDEETDDLPF